MVVVAQVARLHEGRRPATCSFALLTSSRAQSSPQWRATWTGRRRQRLKRMFVQPPAHRALPAARDPLRRHVFSRSRPPTCRRCASKQSPINSDSCTMAARVQKQQLLPIHVIFKFMQTVRRLKRLRPTISASCGRRTVVHPRRPDPPRPPLRAEGQGANMAV